MKYLYAQSNYPDIKDTKPFIFIEDDNGITRYSSDKEMDKWFNNWFMAAKKELKPDQLTLEKVAGPLSNYDVETGNYSGSKADSIGSLIKKFGYDAP